MIIIKYPLTNNIIYVDNKSNYLYVREIKNKLCEILNVDMLRILILKDDIILADCYYKECSKDDEIILYAILSNCNYYDIMRVSKADYQYIEDDKEHILYALLHGKIELRENTIIAFGITKEIILSIATASQYNHAFVIGQIICRYYNDDKDFMLSVLSINGIIYRYLPREFRLKFEIAERAIMSCPRVVKYLLFFKNNVELIKLAVSKSGFVLQYADKSMFLIEDIVVTALQNGFNRLDLIPKEMITKHTILANGKLLRYAPYEMRNDIGFIICAIRQTSEAYNYVPKNLKTNKHIIEETLKNNGMMFKKIPKRFKKDRNFALIALQQDGDVIRFLPSKFKNDKDLVSIALKSNGSNIKYASNDIKNDRDMVLMAVRNKNDGNVLCYVSEQYRDDDQIVEQAVVCNGETLEYASSRLQSDIKIVLKAMGK